MLFDVDEVQTNTELLPMISHKELLSKIGVSVEAASGLGKKVVQFDSIQGPANQFMYGCEAAYTKHYPLILSPDIIWSALIQGLSHHIGLHAEALRPLFVAHQGQKELEIILPGDSFRKGSPENDWESLFATYAEMIDVEIKSEARGLIVPDFTTTGRVERACAQAALMSAMKPYFSYYMGYGCGFPRIELTGTVEDWERLRDKVSRWNFPGDADLSWWTKPLQPVLDGFVSAAKGMSDPEWWKSMMKATKVYMNVGITGWINWLFPYTKGVEDREKLQSLLGEISPTGPRYRSEIFIPGASERNPTMGLIGKPLKTEGFGFTKREDWDGYLSLEGGYPASFSFAPIVVQNRMTGHKWDMEIISGITSVRQDPETMALVPECGWAVRDAVKLG